MNAGVFDRDVRRLQLLVTRAAADCGRWHPELKELDALLHVERAEPARMRRLLADLERDQGDRCSIIRHDIAAELRELLAAR